MVIIDVGRSAGPNGLNTLPDSDTDTDSDPDTCPMQK